LPKASVDVVVISITAPLKIGIYRSGELIDSLESMGKSSDELPRLFGRVLKEYNVAGIYYAKGPGSFMAIKIAYVFLKTVSVAKGIPLYASDAFVFNRNAPIKSIGKNYFVKTAHGIEITRVETPAACQFELPSRLDRKLFSEDATPMYIVPAV